MRAPKRSFGGSRADSQRLESAQKQTRRRFPGFSTDVTGVKTDVAG